MKKLILIIASAVAFNLAAESQSEILDQMVSGVGPENYCAGQSVTNIRCSAFSHHRQLRRFTADSAVDVGSGVFSGCSRLKYLSLKSVTDVSKFSGMFAACMSLSEVHLESIEFSDRLRSFGFPWGVPVDSVRFYFSNGVYNRKGEKVD